MSEQTTKGGYEDNLDNFLPKLHKPYDLLVFIGRFQPIHNAHLEVVRQAVKLTDNLLIIIGSSFHSDNDRTLRNPFTNAERRLMVLESVTELVNRESGFGKVNISVKDGLTDHPDDNVWAASVNDMVSEHVKQVEGKDWTVGIIGCMKNHESFWLEMFPQWELELIQSHYNEMSATDIRQQYFLPSNSIGLEEFKLENCLPSFVQTFLDDFKQRPAYHQVAELALDRQHVLDYLKPYQELPYPPIFVTVDVVVLWAGVPDTKLLLIRRGGRPGKGMFALPGGFMDVNETLRNAAMRELAEETGLDVKSFSQSEIFVTERPLVFDRPNRSLRFRTISHVFGVVIDVKDCPVVNPSDDAEQAFWQNVDEIPTLFEDHNEMVLAMITELQTLLNLNRMGSELN